MFRGSKLAHSLRGKVLDLIIGRSLRSGPEARQSLIEAIVGAVWAVFGLAGMIAGVAEAVLGLAGVAAGTVVADFMAWLVGVKGRRAARLTRSRRKAETQSACCRLGFSDMGIGATGLRALELGTMDSTA